MTVLVTGGCGYIGAHVVHALHQAGERVVVVDDLSYGKPARIEGARLYGMDIAAPGAGDRLAEILDAEDVDSVIHFAARKQVGESVEKPLWYYQQNINGMLNVLIPMLFNRLKQGKAPAIFGDDYPTPDGTCVRDYIHVSDLADAHIAALKYLDRDERKYDAFNVGTGEGTSVRQIVDEVKKVTGLPFTEAVMARRAGDPPHLIGSPKRINEELGWHAKYDVEDIVKSAWDAWQANPEHHIDVATWKQVG